MLSFQSSLSHPGRSTWKSRRLLYEEPLVLTCDSWHLLPSGREVVRLHSGSPTCSYRVSNHVEDVRHSVRKVHVFLDEVEESLRNYHSNVLYIRAREERMRQVERWLVLVEAVGTVCCFVPRRLWWTGRRMIPLQAEHPDSDTRQDNI